MLSQILTNRLLSELKTKTKLFYVFNNRFVWIRRELSDKNVKQMVKSVVNDKPLEVFGEKVKPKNPLLELILKKPNQLIAWYEKTPPKQRKNIYLSLILLYIVYPFGLIAIIYLFQDFMRSEENLFGRTTGYTFDKDLCNLLEKEIFEEMFNKYMTSGSFVPSTDPMVKRLDSCLERIISANDDLEVVGTERWTPILIDDEDMCDIIILKESQNIFISKNLMNSCQTDDELAYVLCHQLSHVFLEHIREPMTYSSIVYYPVIYLTPFMVLLTGDETIRTGIFDRIDDILLKNSKRILRKFIHWNAFNEKLEEESDRLALQLMTRSCFDVRKCREFCRRHKHLTNLRDESKSWFKSWTKEKNFFAKHPITDDKLLYLFQYIKPCIELRKVCNCQPLLESF